MNINPNLSIKNPYKLPKHRFLELRHFCLQYPEWKKRYLLVSKIEASKATDEFSDPVGDTASYLADLDRNIKMVEKAAHEADSYLEPFLLECVTKGVSFDIMATRVDIFCGRNMFYDRYRKLFYVLDILKGI